MFGLYQQEFREKLGKMEAALAGAEIKEGDTDSIEKNLGMANMYIITLVESGVPGSTESLRSAIRILDMHYSPLIARSEEGNGISEARQAYALARDAAEQSGLEEQAGLMSERLGEIRKKAAPDAKNSFYSH